MSTDVKRLNQAIKSLESRYEEIRQLSLTVPSSDDRLEILDRLVLVNHEITQLETLRNHLEASIIEVAPPTDDDVAAMEGALQTLSAPIAADQKWSAAFQALRSALTAIDSLEGNIRKRQK